MIFSFFSDGFAFTTETSFTRGLRDAFLAVFLWVALTTVGRLGEVLSFLAGMVNIVIEHAQIQAPILLMGHLLLIGSVHLWAYATRRAESATGYLMRAFESDAKTSARGFK